LYYIYIYRQDGIHIYVNVTIDKTVDMKGITAINRQQEGLAIANIDGAIKRISELKYIVKSQNGEKCGIIIEGENKWKTVIENASAKGEHI
jgi:hypothetical protein